MAQNSNRGFAGMDPDEQRRIASKGGRAAHASGTAHEWDSEEAAEAGHLGGLAAHHHERAAFHHETAAHHHSRASAHRAAGNSRQAALHGENASRHGRDASFHGEQASRHGERGFAAMDPERQREIARQGGLASHGGRGRDDGQQDEREESAGSSGRTRGGTPEQHAEAGRQGAEARWGRGRDDQDDNEDNEDNQGGGAQRRSSRGLDEQGASRRPRGGNSEQHAEAGDNALHRLRERLIRKTAPAGPRRPARTAARVCGPRQCPPPR